MGLLADWLGTVIGRAVACVAMTDGAGLGQAGPIQEVSRKEEGLDQTEWKCHCKISSDWIVAVTNCADMCS